MKVHCLYRDFFVFLRALDLERDHWRAFKRYYFDLHRDFLSAVWFGHQGFTRRQIRERVAAVRKNDYAHLESALKLFDIEEETRTAIMHCKRVFYHPGRCQVYLFIGFFSPDAFVLRYGGEAVICVGLERFRDFSRYPLLLAHEYFHYVQKQEAWKQDVPTQEMPVQDVWKQGLEKQPVPPSGGRQPGSPSGLEKQRAVLEALVEEGLCVYFSMRAYPERKVHEHCFLSEQRRRELDERFPDIHELFLREKPDLQQLFTSHQERFPGRSGYYLGYRLVTAYAECTGTRDPGALLRSRRKIVLDFMEA